MRPFRYAVLLSLSLALLGSGCAATPPKPSKSLYERVGGLPAVKALVTGSLKRILHDDRVNSYFKGFDLQPLSEHFIQLACVATGGPCKYEGRPMKEVHEGLHITNAAFDAVLEDINFTMRDLKVPQEESDEIMALFNSQRKDVVEIK